MRHFIDILSNIGAHEIFGNPDINIQNISIDSREVKEANAYIAIVGNAQDGHNYIQSAIDKGATAIICSQLPSVLHEHVCYVKVKSTQDVLGYVANAFYYFPSQNLKLIGITGTNGKTTCVTILYQLFTQLGYKCGLISTVKNIIGTEEKVSTHTTPDAIKLNELLAEMRDAQCSHVFMEVSSHAIHQQRILGLQFTGAIFTNITHDHLDYHKTFNDYINAKKKFFDDLDKKAFALVNQDDKRGLVMMQNTAASKHTFSVNGLAEFNVKVIENSIEGLHMQIKNQDVYTLLVGMFNAYNFIAIYAVASLLGENSHQVLEILSKLKSAEGRFEIIKSAKENIVAIVDYAHTPDALLNVLQTIKTVKNDNVQLITVVGCGGDRDALKRPLMGEISAVHSDKVILTSDNPRSEDPNKIIQEMESGVSVNLLKKVVKQVDRKEAIRMACMLAKPQDIILVAGKGHEKYQEINGVKNHFDDKEILFETFNQLEK